MATTAPVTGSAPGIIRTFLLDHERLLIVLIAAAVLWIGIGKYQQIRLDHDNSILAAQKLVLVYFSADVRYVGYVLS